MKFHPGAVDAYHGTVEGPNGAMDVDPLPTGKANPLAVDADPGAVEAHPRAVEAHRGAVETYHGGVEAYPGALEAHPKAVKGPILRHCTLVMTNFTWSS